MEEGHHVETNVRGTERPGGYDAPHTWQRKRKREVKWKKRRRKDEGQRKDRGRNEEERGRKGEERRKNRGRKEEERRKNRGREGEEKRKEGEKQVSVLSYGEQLVHCS